MEEQYPFWLLLHPFPNFSAENDNEDVPIRDYFGFSHALYLLPEFFVGGVSMSGLRGKRVGDSLQQKLIPKNRRQEVERVAESDISTNWHVFVSIFGREIEERVEKLSKWVLFFHYYFF